MTAAIDITHTPAAGAARPQVGRMGKYPVSPQEVDISAVRAQGAGGQNVNKVSSAIHLRFVIRDSTLPEHIKERLLALQVSA